MTEIQQKQFAAKLMSEKEIIDSIRDYVFAPLNDEPRYEKIIATEVRDAADLDYYDAGTVEYYMPDVESITDEQFERIFSPAAKRAGFSWPILVLTTALS